MIRQSICIITYHWVIRGALKLHLAMSLSTVLLMTDTRAQHKFEFALGVDPLVVPVNYGTYVEFGPGFYDINGHGKVTQAVSASFTYWPIPAVGIAIGAGVRNFKSQVDYTIPNPFDEGLEPIAEGFYPFSAKSWGLSVAGLWRLNRWKARIGLSIYDLSDHKYTSNKIYRSVTAFNLDGDQLAKFEMREDAYWSSVPYSYSFLELECQYTIFKHFFVKAGLETTINGQYPYPYTLEITGSTPGTSPEDEILNDFRVRNTLTTFSFGVGYILGFGKYKSDRNDDGL